MLDPLLTTVDDFDVEAITEELLERDLIRYVTHERDAGRDGFTWADHCDDGPDGDDASAVFWEVVARHDISGQQ